MKILLAVILSLVAFGSAVAYDLIPPYYPQYYPRRPIVALSSPCIVVDETANPDQQTNALADLYDVRNNLLDLYDKAQAFGNWDAVEQVLKMIDKIDYLISLYK